MDRMGRIRNIFPPLLVATLVFVPVDIGTSLFWLLGLALCAWGFVRLFLLLVDVAAGKRKDVISRATGPLATILAFVLAIFAGRDAIGRADQFARKSAENINVECHSRGMCPDKLAGWQAWVDPKHSRTQAGGLSKYWLIYSVSDDRKSFALYVSHSIDEKLRLDGGVDAPLSEKLSDG